MFRMRYEAKSNLRENRAGWDGNKFSKNVAQNVQCVVLNCANFSENGGLNQI